jgi:hypothetical protein
MSLQPAQTVSVEKLPASKPVTPLLKSEKNLPAHWHQACVLADKPELNHQAPFCPFDPTEDEV